MIYVPSALVSLGACCACRCPRVDDTLADQTAEPLGTVPDEGPPTRTKRSSAVCNVREGPHRERRGVRRSRKLFAAAHSGCIDPCARAPAGGVRKLLDRWTSKREKIRRFESQLQLKVMRFADGYVDAVSRACARAQSEATDSRLRYRLVDFQIKQATAAVQIAAGPNPSINAVDMVVLASLTRASVAHNLPATMGSKAQPIIEAFARLEKGAWPLVDFLTPAQEADLRRRLAAWTPDAASLDSVTFNRLEDFAKASGLPANQQSAPNSILALIGADPLAGLRPAVREIERSRILGERAIYYAERTPMLLDLQTRALGAAVADMPETRSVIATANRVGESAALLADTVVMLPETFRKEREATIQQLLTAMEQQQGVMRELMVEVRQSLEAVPKASDSIRGVLDGIDALMRRPKAGEPPPPGSFPGAPSTSPNTRRRRRQLAIRRSNCRRWSPCSSTTPRLRPSLATPCEVTPNAWSTTCTNASLKRSACCSSPCC